MSFRAHQAFGIGPDFVWVLIFSMFASEANKLIFFVVWRCVLIDRLIGSSRANGEFYVVQILAKCYCC